MEHCFYAEDQTSGHADWFESQFWEYLLSRDYSERNYRQCWLFLMRSAENRFGLSKHEVLDELMPNEESVSYGFAEAISAYGSKVRSRNLAGVNSEEEIKVPDQGSL